MSGIVVAIMPKFLSQGIGDGNWIALNLASFIPSAVSSVMREVCCGLSAAEISTVSSREQRIFRDDRVKMDAFYMSFWCSLYNVTLGLPMILFSGEISSQQLSSAQLSSDLI